jgi:uncharacterized protein YkwD
MKQHIKTAVWAHQENNYVPVALKLPILTAFSFVIALCLFASYLQTYRPEVLGTTTLLNQQNIVEELNISRQQHGVGQLQPNEQLNRAAQAKASDMTSHKYWSHVAPDGTTPWQWIDKTGYSYSVAGENLARGFSTTPGVMTAWEESPTHRDNMLDGRYRDVGVAVVPSGVYGHESTIVVLLLAKPSGLIAAGSNEQSVLAGRTQAPEMPHKAIFGQFAAISIRYMQPFSLVALGMLLMLAVLGTLAHIRFIAVPRELRKSWRAHQGLYTAVIACISIFATILLFGGAQI